MAGLPPTKCVKYFDNAFAGDLHLHLFGADVELLVGEVKARASGEGFKTLARWLDEQFCANVSGQ